MSCTICRAAEERIIDGRAYCASHGPQDFGSTERCRECSAPATRSIFGYPYCATHGQPNGPGR